MSMIRSFGHKWTKDKGRPQRQANGREVFAPWKKGSVAPDLTYKMPEITLLFSVTRGPGSEPKCH